MSRKPPTDTFTRFTSTTPSQTPQSQPSFTVQPPTPSNETPQQRVARLRAQHNANRASQISSTDRVLARGRRFADIFHRATAYTLLGFSAAATLVAAYGIVSLISHNRTQKRAWIEREMDKLEGARASFLKGEADAEQLHLLEQERAGEVLMQRHEEEKRRRKWSTKIKGFFGADTGDKGEGETLRERGQRIRREMDEPADAGVGASAGTGDESLAQTHATTFRMGDAELQYRPAAVAETSIGGVGLDEKGRPVPIEKLQRTAGRGQNKSQSQNQTQGSSAILEAVQARRGGQLDQLAGNISSDVSSAGSSIWSSIFGGGSRS